MALENEFYGLYDLEEMDIELAPTIDIPNIVTDHCFISPEKTFMLFQTHVSQDFMPADGCPFCRKDTPLIKSGKGAVKLVHDVARDGCRVDIALMPPRFQCKKCGNRFTPHIPGFVDESQMTERLQQFLRTEVFLQPSNMLAERTGFSETYIGDILDAEIDKKDAERKANPIEAPEVIGIDEKHFDGVARGTLLDLTTNTLIDIFPDNKKDTMIGAIKSLKDWDKNIKVIVTDMASGYFKWLSEYFPEITVVIDHYHVMQDVNRKVRAARLKCYKYRKALIDQIEDPVEKARQAGILRIVKDNTYLFNYSTARITREKESTRAQKLAVIIAEFPEFKMLHNIRYLVEYMYTKLTYEEASDVWDEWEVLLPPAGKKAYKDWCDAYDIDPSLFEDFRTFDRYGFKRFKEVILNYFKPGCRFTNGPTEEKNKDIGRYDYMGAGLNFKRLRGKALYAPLMRSRKIYRIRKETITSWTPVMGYTDFNWINQISSQTPRGRKQTQTLFEFIEEEFAVSIPPYSTAFENSWLGVISSDKIAAKANELYYLSRPDDQPREFDYPALCDAGEILSMVKYLYEGNDEYQDLYEDESEY